MSGFKEMFPESGIAGPNQFKVGVFDKMRHRDLVKLAKAFAIPIDPESTKEDMIPLFKAEEAKGRFKKPPSDARAYARLAYPNDPDQWPAQEIEEPKRGPGRPPNNPG